jgi:hypothetical protein
MSTMDRPASAPASAFLTPSVIHSGYRGVGELFSYSGRDIDFVVLANRRLILDDMILTAPPWIVWPVLPSPRLAVDAE